MQTDVSNFASFIAEQGVFIQFDIMQRVETSSYRMKAKELHA